MTADPKNPGKPRRSRGTGRRPGRPTREEAEARRIRAVGVDPALVDPRRILAAIAIDQEAPAAARVSACRTLIASGTAPAHEAGVPIASTGDELPPDELTRRALELMAARGRPN